MKIFPWVIASRPKTLFASLTPVLVGTSHAFLDKKSINIWLTLSIFFCAALIQILTNFANDLYDNKKGVDNSDRVGPQRVTSTNMISHRDMTTAIYITTCIIVLLGTYISLMSSYIIFIIGVLSVIVGYLYTAGPYPLSYHALGDATCFLFFGPIATAGTYYVHTLSLTELSLWCGISIGALNTAILVVNNYRDIETDKKYNKQTLAVLIGKKATLIEYVILVNLPYIVCVYIYYLSNEISILLPLLSFPVSVHLIIQISTRRGKELNRTLFNTSMLTFFYGFLISIAIWLK